MGGGGVNNGPCLKEGCSLSQIHREPLPVRVGGEGGKEGGRPEMPVCSQKGQELCTAQVKGAKREEEHSRALSHSFPIRGSPTGTLRALGVLQEWLGGHSWGRRNNNA